MDSGVPSQGTAARPTLGGTSGPLTSGLVSSDTLELVFNTPVVRLKRLVEEGWAEVMGKLEGANPTGSVKDRTCLGMVLAAESAGLLKKGATVVEPTSGNTGISLAMIAAVRGYSLILVMPENVPSAQKALLKLYGAELELTPASEGMIGAIRRAEKILEKSPDFFMPNQFTNPANPDIHRRTTAEEIWQATGGELDAFVAGVGTGGTITGVGEVLKERLPEVLVVAVEPKGSAVLSGGSPGMHKIYGLGAGFPPKLLNRDIIDRIITVSDEDALSTTYRLAKEEGLMVGVSSGASTFAALRVAKELGKGKRVVTIFPDRGEKYIDWYQSM